ncbi:MAG: amylo-alpha-1,6-glucosidase [Pyrinomonadaceae bacterium]
MITINADICHDFEAASSREWLETNGIGGYASSSISGANTRRYHGLLIAATKPPLGRVVLLSKFEETLTIGDKGHDLSCNQYPGQVHPIGYRLLSGFRLDPFPVWTYEVDGVALEKTIFMVQGENSTVCRWRVIGEAEADAIFLTVRPLLAFRDHHHLGSFDPEFNCNTRITDGSIWLEPYSGMPGVHLFHNGTDVKCQPDWYWNFEYGIEQERGFDYREDLFQPGSITFDLAEDALVIATTEERHVSYADDLEKSELLRREKVVAVAGPKDEATKTLVMAANQFIVKRGTGQTVIAGYHWFSDWGRDTMIALNGLTLATGRPEITRSILSEFASHVSEGMLPNRFPDTGVVPDYNTVDATLWFFEAVRAYASVTGDANWVRQNLYDKLIDIIDWHVRGTRYQIHVETDGLLYAGEPSVQLTWMDAKVGDRVITPRTGKAVEIQALWYNALCIIKSLSREFGDGPTASGFNEMAVAARKSFNQQFWNEADGCLYDVVSENGLHRSVRPNQIFAVSLPHTMLAHDTALRVVNKVERDLLTPYGLRSLSPSDPNYVGTYNGSPDDRDASYHQGTVWAWLIGPFVDAYRRVHADDPQKIRFSFQLISNLHKHLSETMVGQVSEIFDGDPPHTPRGCAAQAWSVAELLRIAKSA